MSDITMDTIKGTIKDLPEQQQDIIGYDNYLLYCLTKSPNNIQ